MNGNTGTKRTQAQEIAYSRGRCAKINGESKSGCPYPETSPFYDFWMDGHDSGTSQERAQ